MESAAYKSEAIAGIHETMKGLYKSGEPIEQIRLSLASTADDKAYIPPGMEASFVGIRRVSRRAIGLHIYNAAPREMSKRSSQRSAMRRIVGSGSGTIGEKLREMSMLLSPSGRST